MTMNRLVRLCLFLLIGSACLELVAADHAAPPRFRIAYATYLGGNEWDQAREVLVHRDGSVLIGAQTNSESVPKQGGEMSRRFRLTALA